MEDFLKKEIELLPQEARKLLGEFCEFLLKKYSNATYKQAKRGNIEKAILADQIRIDTKQWKFNREEIYGE